MLLEKSFGSVIHSTNVLSKVDIHNEIEYSEDREKLSRYRVLVLRRQVKRHRQRGEVDLFAQIIKETTAAQVAQQAIENSCTLQQQQAEGGQLGGGDGVRRHQVLSKQLTARDHQHHQMKQRLSFRRGSLAPSTAVTAGAVTRAGAGAGEAGESVKSQASHSQNKTIKRSKLRRSIAGFYHHPKPELTARTPSHPPTPTPLTPNKPPSRRGSIQAMTSRSIRHSITGSSAPPSVTVHTRDMSISGDALDRRLRATGGRGRGVGGMSRPPPVRVFSVRNKTNMMI